MADPPRTWYAQPVTDPGRLVQRVQAVHGAILGPIFVRMESTAGVDLDFFRPEDPFTGIPTMNWNQLLFWAWPGGITEQVTGP